MSDSQRPDLSDSGSGSLFTRSTSPPALGVRGRPALLAFAGREVTLPTLLWAISDDYKLTDLLSTAGATIGIIIAGTIFLQFVNTKYMELAGRYRELAREYRGVPGEHGRHAPLRTLIQRYRQRLVLLNRASWLAAVALLAFLSAVLIGGLSMLFPPVVAFRTAGTGGLMGGLLLILIAVMLNLMESVMARTEIGDEIADLDDEARQTAC